MRLRYVVFAMVGLSVLVIVWGIRRVRALPAEESHQMTSGLRSRASVGAILGVLAILLGLVWWMVYQGLVNWPLFESLGYIAVSLAGLVLSSVGLALSIKARGGDMKRQAIAGKVLNLWALLILAYPVCFVFFVLLWVAFAPPLP